ncbi:uncharacterized protein LOC110465298 [Mizuhopecten yessoensis]|uniref:uncharacterized protein LOC110465298 n=1 Tax=Mizuhopecten yessoensis TaxID=6573 RepID=UPI000B45F248|nr:uncharacterized protein LOC110465298 [Mizuhopecten yessoensis]
MELIRHMDNSLFIFGRKDHGVLYWMISALRKVGAGWKNFILTSKMKVPPDYNDISDDALVPDSDFFDDQLDRTKVIGVYAVYGNLQLQINEHQCIRSINVDDFDQQSQETAVTIDIRMFLSTDAPDVLWRVTLKGSGDVPSTIKFESVVCPANITIDARDSRTGQGVNVRVTFLEVDGDFNIGKFITVQGYYTDLTEPSDGKPTDIVAEAPAPLSETTTAKSSQEKTSENPSHEQTSEHPFQEKKTTSKQLSPRQTSITQILTTQTSTSQRYTTRITPVTTGETKMNSTLKCYEDLPRNWNTQINSSELQALQAEVVKLKQSLAVNKSALSSTIRRKNSAPDMRISSKIMGYVGGAIMAVIFGGLVIIDLPTIAKALKLMKRNVMGK